MYHKSHSRKDLIDIIKLFKLPIEDPDDHNKKVLTEKLVTCLETIDTIEPDKDYYGILSLNDLKEYLLKPIKKKYCQSKIKIKL